MNFRLFAIPAQIFISSTVQQQVFWKELQFLVERLNFLGRYTHYYAWHKMRLIVTDVAWFVCMSVCVGHVDEPYQNG